jgi:transcriptional regulator with XRE-family HTH domain
MKAIAAYLEDAGMSVEELVDASGLDKRTVRSIVAGQYTPSPAQRQCLAGALGVPKEAIAWGHTVPVQHLRGNGPQFGRST